MFKDIADPRISSLRRGIRCGFFRGCLDNEFFSLIRLRIRVEEMLHGKPPDLPAPVKLRDHRPSSAARGEEFSRIFRIADGRGESDPSGMASGQLAQPFDQAEGLHPPVATQERMDLVDHDEAQITEQGRDLHVLVDHQRLQRFRRYLQNAGRFAQQFPLFRLRHIPVPAVNLDPLLLAKLVQPSELIVDQRLQRCHIKHTDRL